MTTDNTEEIQMKDSQTGGICQGLHFQVHLGVDKKKKIR